MQRNSLNCYFLNRTQQKCSFLPISLLNLRSMWAGKWLHMCSCTFGMRVATSFSSQAGYFRAVWASPLFLVSQGSRFGCRNIPVPQLCPLWLSALVANWLQHSPLLQPQSVRPGGAPLFSRLGWDAGWQHRTWVESKLHFNCKHLSRN